MLELFSNANLIHIIGEIGYIGVFTIIFIETALFVGFFLPGDSLLFIAGLLAYQGVLDPYILILGACVCGIAGYAVAYFFGAYVGHKMERWPDRWWYKRSFLIKSRQFFQKRGLAAIVLARFVPIVRTFIPIVAGMAHMPLKRYTVCNIIGGVLWGAGLPLLGMLVSSLIPNPLDHLKTIILVVVVVSVLPMLVEVIRNYMISKRNTRNQP